MSDPFGMEGALIEIEAENPLAFVYEGTEYPCSRGDITASQSLGFGGYAPSADMVLVVRKSAFSAPALKIQIVVNGRTFLLDQSVECPNGVFAVWSLIDPNKAA